MDIIGRQHEISKLNQLSSSKKAEFIAIYGRRRIGKTYLIREFFKNESCYFEMTGEKNAPLKKQLSHFARSLGKTFYNGAPLATPQSWHTALNQLTESINTKWSHQKKIILFFDELPWIASKKSGFLQALDHIWNAEWNRIANLKLIVCGSAASWMLEKLIHAKGGLYNRLTARILLKPFSLAEVQDYLNKIKKMKLQKERILELYMILGGVPFYLEQINKNKSVGQNINDLCFKETGLLFDEFNHIFHSLFDQAQTHEKIIREVAQRRYGISRKDLLKKLKIKTGGRFNKKLTELEAAGFIETFIPYGHKKKNYFIKVIDEYCLFYLRWIEPLKALKAHKLQSQYWSHQQKTPRFSAWSGYAFESVCHKHIIQILKTLKIENISQGISTWKYQAQNKQTDGTQIDLLIDRTDQTINLCEIKYSQKPFLVDKYTAKSLVNKMDIFESRARPKKQLLLCLITSPSLKKNAWSDELIDGVVELKDLFRN